MQPLRILRPKAPTNAHLVGSEASLFSISRLRLGLWPILATIGMGLLIVVPSGYGPEIPVTAEVAASSPVVPARF
jgi:hypothetical protein